MPCSLIFELIVEHSSVEVVQYGTLSSAVERYQIEEFRRQKGPFRGKRYHFEEIIKDFMTSSLI